MPRYWNKKVLLAKTETTYGTDAAPTGAANAILATNVTLSPMEGQDVARALERPQFGADATIASDLHQKLTFRVELAPSGTPGQPPAWSPLLVACGCAATAAAGTNVTYNPITDAPSSVTIHFHYDGIRHQLTGARGTFRIVIEASAIPYIEFEFWGLFAPAAGFANPTPTLTAFKDPQIANATNTPTFTIDGTAMVMRSFTFDGAVAVEPRFLIGSESILITGRNERVEARIEALPVQDFNPYVFARSSTQMPIVLRHGVGAGRIATLNIPKAQLMRPSGVEVSQNIAEWPLVFAPQMDTGNDQWTLVLT